MIDDLKRRLQKDEAGDGRKNLHKLIEFYCKVYYETSPEAINMMENVVPSDCVSIVKGIVMKLSEHKNWDDKPQGLSGAILVAKMGLRYGEKTAMEILISFLEKKKKIDWVGCELILLKEIYNELERV
jgi:hypothetical protein